MSNIQPSLLDTSMMLDISKYAKRIIKKDIVKKKPLKSIFSIFDDPSRSLKIYIFIFFFIIFLFLYSRYKKKEDRIIEKRQKIELFLTNLESQKLLKNE